MAGPVLHIEEAEAANDFASLIARVRAGFEVVIESGSQPVAVLHTPAPARRSITECVALLPEESTATIDPDFAKDVALAIESQCEPLAPPKWD
jgi:antitoxin (DNA-binding transcriptional repressor) of toxin-antitoxin stability system